ncbi:MAG: YhbD family protein [Bacillota bacterium]|nr:YhbD family protein [Bacillota bacterium]
MDENLISKKDLLSITGISYGQLYRWKRKNLIPEDWFIKKSSFTGQETFFPRKEILERVEKIKNFKDDVSLDDLADLFSPQMYQVFLTQEDILNKNIVSQMTMDIYNANHKEESGFSFQQILFLYIIEKFLNSGEAGIEEGKVILTTLEENYKNFNDKSCDVFLIRKFGIAVCLLSMIPNEFYIEKGAKLVLKVNAAECVEELKRKLML